jgi:hypothetical protein
MAAIILPSQNKGISEVHGGGLGVICGFYGANRAATFGQYNGPIRVDKPQYLVPTDHGITDIGTGYNHATRKASRLAPIGVSSAGFVSITRNGTCGTNSNNDVFGVGSNTYTSLGIGFSTTSDRLTIRRSGSDSASNKWTFDLPLGQKTNIYWWWETADITVAPTIYINGFLFTGYDYTSGGAIGSPATSNALLGAPSAGNSQTTNYTIHCAAALYRGNHSDAGMLTRNPEKLIQPSKRILYFDAPSLPVLPSLGVSAVILPSKLKRQPQGITSIAPAYLDSVMGAGYAKDLGFYDVTVDKYTPFIYPTDLIKEYGKHGLSMRYQWSSNVTLAGGYNTVKNVAIPGVKGSVSILAVFHPVNESSVVNLNTYTSAALGLQLFLGNNGVKANTGDKFGSVTTGNLNGLPTRVQRVCIVVVDWAKDTLSIYLDSGQQSVVSLNTAGGDWAASHNGYLAGTSTSSGLLGFAMFNRALGDSERNELLQNPWQIFKPKKQVIYSFGSSFPVLTSLGVSNITSSGGRLTAST